MKTLRSAMLVLASGFLATPALALEVRQSVDVAATPEQVWQVIGEFCAIADWHPVIAQCAGSEQEGAVMRTLTTVDGGVLLEQRVQYSDEGMSYTYEILESPLPVQDYVSTIAVMAGPGGSTITWSSEFAAKDAPDAQAVEVITGIYQVGLAALKEQLH